MLFSISHAVKRYGDHTVIQDLSADFPDRGLYVITGPSGCGKTTLLRMIAGLEKPDAGHVVYEGRKAMSFQEYRLFPQLTAMHNASAMSSASARHATEAKASDMLKRLGFREDQLQLYPAQLSGGMKQRVSLVRALCADAELVLLDEPFRELDAALCREVLAMITERSV